jgi:hypothetical protein
LKSKIDELSSHFKNIWKVDTITLFNEEVTKVQVKLLPILEKLTQPQMRKEHFIQIYDLLDIKPHKDEVFFNSFLIAHITDYTDKVFEICQVSLDQMLLRKET